MRAPCLRGRRLGFFGRDPRRLPFLTRALAIVLALNLLSMAWGVWQILDLFAKDEFGQLSLFSASSGNPLDHAAQLHMTLLYPIAGALASWLLSLALLFTYGRSKMSFEALSMMTVIHPCYVVVTAVGEMTGIFSDIAEADGGDSSQALESALSAGIDVFQDRVFWSFGIALVIFVILRGLAWQPKEVSA